MNNLFPGAPAATNAELIAAIDGYRNDLERTSHQTLLKIDKLREACRARLELPETPPP